MLHLRNSSRSALAHGADNLPMGSTRHLRFSKGGYSLYMQADLRGGALGTTYSVYDAGEQLMDELPSLGEACALIERLTRADTRAEPPALVEDGTAAV